MKGAGGSFDHHIVYYPTHSVPADPKEFSYDVPHGRRWCNLQGSVIRPIAHVGVVASVFGAWEDEALL